MEQFIRKLYERISWKPIIRLKENIIIEQLSCGLKHQTELSLYALIGCLAMGLAIGIRFHTKTRMFLFSFCLERSRDFGCRVLKWTLKAQASALNGMGICFCTKLQLSVLDLYEWDFFIGPAYEVRQTSASLCIRYINVRLLGKSLLMICVRIVSWFGVFIFYIEVQIF